MERGQGHLGVSSYCRTSFISIGAADTNLTDHENPIEDRTNVLGFLLAVRRFQSSALELLVQGKMTLSYFVSFH